MLRRNLLIGAAALPVGGGLLRTERADARELPALKDAAARAGLTYGSDSDAEFATAPAAYRDLFVQQCALYAGLFLWPPKCAKQDESCPPFIDPNIDFVLRHGLRLTGGHLMYHQDTPEWFGELDRRTAEQRMVRHIDELAGRYAGRVFSWNVFNELINPQEGRPDGIRNIPVVHALGFDMFDIAFRAARRADPNALLALNDYSLEMATEEHEARRTALLRLLDLLQQKGVPIDAVGIQSHITLDGTRFDPERFRRFLHQIASRGLTILITELDVLDIQPSGGSIAQRDAAVAAMYAEYLRTALDEPAVASVVNWGLSDRYTWMTPQRWKGFARADGQPVRPLPFDADFQPKPAFEAILNAFEHAPKRPPVSARAHLPNPAVKPAGGR